MQSSAQQPSDPLSASPILEFEDVHWSHYGQKIIDGVSFKVYPGESFVLLAQSGQGKTSFLRLCSGLEKAQSGKVRMFGHDLKAMDPIKLLNLRAKMGFVFQNSGLISNQTLYQNVALPLTYHRGFHAHHTPRHVNKMAERSGISPFLKSRPANVSVGVQRRTAIARALILEPDIVFYDEPTVGLDPINFSAVMEMITAEHQRGAATIIVTHSVSTATKLADKVAILNQGNFIFFGHFDELSGNKNNYIQEFIGKG